MTCPAIVIAISPSAAEEEKQENDDNDESHFNGEVVTSLTFAGSSGVLAILTS